MKAFEKVLVANRGEIALRVLRALRKLGIPSVAICHDIDRESPVVQQADEAVEIVGESPTSAHLDIAQIVDICQRLGVDGVHPGYGFLSENAGFAQALEKAGIKFIGPTPDVIKLMGDKIISRNFVEQHGFPVPPSLSVDLQALAEHGYQSLLSEVEQMGFPVVVKAAAGGGGKGMNIVSSPADLESSLRISASEAGKYFGDTRIYIERYFSSARHIEVQVLGDGDNVVHLGVRECSIQRRFQKVIEEAPSPALSKQKEQEICEVAVGIAKSAHYTSAGTVEFLYTPEGEFYFLEMNTRIQVEHPVTELVYDIDLVSEQIKVASGHPLSIAQQDVVASGHAIECRICAEDPFNNFMPETGRVLYLKEPTGENVRFDSSLYENQIVGSAFDPMLAKLVVHAPSRDQAIQQMKAALKSLVILGVKTNIEYLLTLLNHPNVVTGDFDTGFIAAHAEELQQEATTRDQEQVVLASAYLSDRNTRLLFEATPEIYAQIGAWKN